MKVNIWYIMLWEFKNNNKKKNNTIEIAKKICRVITKVAFITKFFSGNISLRSDLRLEHSSNLNQAALRELV